MPDQYTRGSRPRSRPAIEGGTASEIARSAEEAIRTGRFSPGDRLPTIRSLAASLGVSPVTVASAYRELRRRGVVAAAGRRGTRVTERPPLTLPGSPITGVPAGARDLATGNPDPDLLPSLATALATIDPTPRLYGSPTKLESLVELARNQFEADGLPAPRVALAGGALDGIERVLAAHLRPGDTVAVEDPGYARVFDLLRGTGYELEGFGGDDSGPVPDELERALRRGARAAILTPRAQNPTGAALDERRARDLRALLGSRPDVLVVEDDHAGAIAGAPAFTTCQQSRPRFAIVRSVSKALGPDLRVALISGDAETIARVEGRQLLGTGWVSAILQQLVVRLWSDPGVSELLERAASTYGTRRSALLEALSSRGIAARGRSGLNVWIPVPEEAGAVSALLQRGWAVAAGERWRLGRSVALPINAARLRTPPAIRVTAATLLPEEAGPFAADLADALATGTRTYSA
ncbi:MAG TPA: aminotransferase class I/II-fold pyridoxal phosphate-dependent enzyme [Actinomycetota bacterium]